MAKQFVKLVGFLPLLAFGSEKVVLDSVDIIDIKEEKKEYKESSFYKTYSSELITKEDIEESSANTITDVLKNVSNVQVKDRGSFSKNISIRGLGGERVVSVVDGAKMSNHGMTMGGGGELSLINVSSVEKIEVIKGSPSIIYDPGATGGVVKVSTIKNPRDMEDKAKADYTYSYDAGYMLNKHAASAEVKYSDIYISIGGSSTVSDGRRVKDQEKQDEILYDLDEEAGTKYAITDLGYETKSWDALLNYQFHDSASVFFKHYGSESDDITQAYGSTEPQVFHYKDYDFKGNTGGINAKDVLGLSKIDFIYSDSKQYRSSFGASNSLDEVMLDSQTFKLMVEANLDVFFLQSGLEYTHDDAETLTLSNQDYIAGYVSGEYIGEVFSVNAGLRYNKYHVEQELKPGQNPDTARDLVGVSGILDEPLDDDAFNYSAGILYSLNENNNLAFNYARTYRYPSLYERFAFGGGFMGGGEDMKPEEADNFELSYKHLSDEMSIVATLFYSDFDTYNRFRTHNTLKPEFDGDLQAFLDCEENVDCDPFDSVFKYESFDDVENLGFEFDLTKEIPDYGLTMNFLTSLSHLTDAKYQTANMPKPLIVKFSQDPLEFGFNIKKDFSYEYKPWLTLKLRYVTDLPEVEQQDKYGNKDYNAFGVADLYFGAKSDMFSFNAGVRNLTDAVYHEPYAPLDGVERTFFFNLGITLEALL